MQKNSGTCLGSRCHGQVFGEQNQSFCWRLKCTIQIGGENTQMWVVWALSALIGFCIGLSFCQKMPGEARSRSRKRS